MRHEELSGLMPGPETDLLVADALGDIVVSGDVALGFSQSYDAAWKIVEHIRSKGWLVRVQEMPDGVPWLHNDTHEVMKRSVCVLYPMWVQESEANERITAYGETSIMAIIRALLMWKALH